MSVINADFTARYQHYPLWVRLALLVLALVMLAVCIKQYLSVNEALQNQRVEQNTNQLMSEAPTITKEQLALFAQLQAIEADLNIPWLALLTELETLKVEHTDVTFNAIEPSREKQTLKLKAQTDDFGKIVNFITAMRASTVFSNVSLVQHEDKKQTNQPAKQGAIEFALMTNWQANVK